ncbi:MAG: VanZ family protein [Thiobacillus sp.]
MRPLARHAAARGPLWLFALAYTLFVVYGSLVPLEFRALPWDEAVARFRAIPFLQLGIGSRADWVANLLLFIPLTYLWMGMLSAGRGASARILTSFVLIPLALALSLAIEFTQLYFPQRTVSQNDILAETLGGVFGVIAWWASGERFLDWLQGWQRLHERAAFAERLAWVYLAGVLVYNVLPLDLTLSVVELFHKWQDGNVNLIPFNRLPPEPADALYEIATDVLIWAPLALLWRIDGTRSSLRTWGMTWGTAGLLEVLQLFVYSRVSDVTDLFTAATGAALGVWLASRLARRGAPMSEPLSWGAWVPFMLAAGWAAALLFVFWFPFDFRSDGTFIKSRFELLWRAPFTAYYFGTEFRAVTELLHKTLFFGPLGALLAWGVARQPWRWRGPLFAFSMIVLLFAPVIVEVGQLMLPQKFVDSADIMLAWGGGVLGYAFAQRLLRAAPARPSPARSALAPKMRYQHTRQVNKALHFMTSVGVLALLFWLISQAAFMPYNVREMLVPEARTKSALLLAVACHVLAVWPVWLARRSVSGPARLGQLPVGLAAYGGATFLLLYVAVPEESLHDLVGTPVLGWPWQWETALRWTALAAVPGTLIYLAAQTVRRWRGLRLGALHFWAAAPVLVLTYWGVVVQAATDNLTELLAAPKALGFMAVCASVYVTVSAAALVASPGRRWYTAVLVSVLSVPLAGGLLAIGLAGEIDKYGQQFSALQFLLSRDRLNYANPFEIALRYGALHVLVVATLASLQSVHFRSARREKRHAPDESD